jgi:hypothetical protein
MIEKLRNLWWVDIAFLALVSGITYLPDVLSLSYYRDDWYYMYDGLVAGPKIFEIMFLHLRPARGPFFAFLFSLFGTSPLPYHLLSYFWRFLGGLGLMWMFELLWPKQRNARFFAALMFTIYPGYLWWIAGVEYQPMVFSLGLHVFSIALTFKAVQTENVNRRIIWIVLSVLMGLYALALVDYAIGMEVFRWLGIFVLVNRRPSVRKWGQKVLEAFKQIAPFLLIPLFYLGWRQVFFENWRKATDVGLQLDAIFSSLNSFLWWLIYLVQSTLNVSVFAWGVPFSNIFYSNRLRDILIGLTFTTLGLIFILLADRILSDKPENSDEIPENWVREAILLGIFGTVVGVLPIVLGNRTVAFGRFSHYTLPASLAGILLLAGLVYSLKDRFARNVVLGLVVGLAMLTHRGLSAQARTEEAMIQNFWWQMSWRAPDLKEGVLLIAEYPFYFADDVDVVYGPANFIYYPEKQVDTPVKLAINAEVVQGETVTDILLGKKERVVNYYDAHEYYVDFGNVLIVAQTSANACLRVIDPRWPNISRTDGSWMSEAAAKSKVENIDPSGTSHLPPEYLFGPEPEHDWCYYFQKADLARQIGDWGQVAQLYDEAKKLELTPNDQIELIPFVQAFAYLGDEQKVKQISTIINADDWYKLQACQILGGMSDQGYPLQPDMGAYVDELFCGGDG